MSDSINTTYYTVMEDMDHNNYEMRGLSTDFKEAADIFQTFVDLGKSTMFEMRRVTVIAGRVVNEEVLRSTG